MNICDKMSDNEIKLTGIAFMCAAPVFREGLRLRGALTIEDELLLGVAVKSPVNVGEIRYVLNKIYSSIPEDEQ